MTEDFQFHPDLFDYRAQVTELLASHGYEWLSDYSTIDLQHDVNGLEIFGLANENVAFTVSGLIRQAFPEFTWHYVYEKDFGSRDPGWVVSFCKVAKEVPTFLENSDPEPQIIQPAGPDPNQVLQTRGYVFAEAIKELLTNADPKPLQSLLRWKVEKSDEENSYLPFASVALNYPTLREIIAGVTILNHPMGQYLLDFNPELLSTQPRMFTKYVDNYRLLIKLQHDQWGVLGNIQVIDEDVSLITTPVLKNSATARQVLNSFIRYAEQWILFNLIYELSGSTKCAKLSKLGDPDFSLFDQPEVAPHAFALFKLACHIDGFKQNLTKQAELL